MATASRTRHAAGAKPRPRSSAAGVLAALDSARGWIVPILAVLGVAACAILSRVGLVETPHALAASLIAALVLVLSIGLRPLLAPGGSPRARALGAGLGVVWLVACYYPFHARLFPGTPLVNAAQVTAAGAGLPLRIPASGHRAVDLLLEGKLNPNPTGGAAPPVRFWLTLADARTVEGIFEDTLRTQRLGRRGTAVVHQAHTADLRVISNPTREDMTITQLTLEPANAQPISITAFGHPLPGPFVLTLAALALLAAVVAFDRLGPVPETDGALTLATAAAVGAAIIFWTGNAVHPDFSTLIGSAIFGGPLGFLAGGIVWWIAKRVIVRPAP